MSEFNLLMNNICNDNDYLLSFQTTDESRNLAKALIDIRDNESLVNVSTALNNMIELLNKNIVDCADPIKKDYFEEILKGLIISQKRIMEFS